MKMPKRIALLGCAHIHVPDYLSRLQKRQDVELVALYDHDERRANATAQRAGVPAKPLEAVLDEVQAVLVCSETNRHDELINRVVRAKKDLFVEKPLATTTREARQLAQVITQAEIIFHAGYFLRELPAHKFVRDQIRQGAYGRVTRARAAFSHGGALRGWFDAYPWMLDSAQAGFGGFGDLGAHALDLLMWLFSKEPFGEAEAVGAEIARVDDYPFDTHGEGMVKFGSVLGTVAASWVDAAGLMALEVYGTEGYARVKNGTLEGGPTSVLSVAPSADMGLDVFLDALTGQPALVSPSEAARNVELLEGLYGRR